MIYLSVGSWAAFKALAATKQLGIHYVEYPSHYEVILSEGTLTWGYGLLRDGNSDVLDFEQNFKALSNRPSFFLGQFRNRYRNLTGNTSVTVKSGSGVLRGLSINNNNTGGVVTLYDNTEASGPLIATLQIGTPSGGLLSNNGLQSPIYNAYIAEFATGLTVVTSGSNSNNITLYYV